MILFKFEFEGAPAPQFMDIVADPTTLPLDSSIVHCMACCHSLIHLNGELTGNPLDVKLFEAIEWDMKEQFNVGVNPDYGVPTPTLVCISFYLLNCIWQYLRIRAVHIA